MTTMAINRQEPKNTLPGNEPTPGPPCWRNTITRAQADMAASKQHGPLLLYAQRRLTRRPRRNLIILKHGPLAAGGEHMLELAFRCLNHLPQGHKRIRDAKEVNPPGQDPSGGACFQPRCVEHLVVSTVKPINRLTCQRQTKWTRQKKEKTNQTSTTWRKVDILTDGKAQLGVANSMS